VLTDTGPLVAILDRNDDQHAACIHVLQSLKQGPLVTTWPCFTEAFYLLSSVGGRRSQTSLWEMRRTGRLMLLDITHAEADRMQELTEQYSNVPMDLADASLVAVAESRGYPRLFSVDSDFYIYRMIDGSVLELVR
jgi:predicted nucleic acid-binding protein